MGPAAAPGRTQESVHLALALAPGASAVVWPPQRSGPTIRAERTLAVSLGLAAAVPCPAGPWMGPAGASGRSRELVRPVRTPSAAGRHRAPRHRGRATESPLKDALPRRAAEARLPTRAPARALAPVGRTAATPVALGSLAGYPPEDRPPLAELAAEPTPRCPATQAAAGGWPPAESAPPGPAAAPALGTEGSPRQDPAAVEA